MANAAISYTALVNWKRHPDIATAFGEMVLAWANAENVMLFTFSHAAQIDANLALLTYYRIPTFEARTKVIVSLLSEPKCQLANRTVVLAAAEKLAKLAQARNAWIHGNFWTDGKTVVSFDYRLQSHKPRTRPIKSNDINLHVDAVRQRTKDLEALLPMEPYFASP